MKIPMMNTLLSFLFLFSLFDASAASWGVAEVLYTFEGTDEEIEGLVACTTHDIDDDGVDEVIFASGKGSQPPYLITIVKWSPSGGGTWNVMKDWTTNTEPYELSVNDIDNDGILDLVIGTFEGVEYVLNFLLGDPDQNTVVVHNNGICQGMDVLDLDGDGLLDIVTGRQQKSIHWFKNNGEGNSWSNTTISFTKTCGVHAVLAADVDGDGEVEMVLGGDEFPLAYIKHQPQTSLDLQENWNIQFLIEGQTTSGSNILPCAVEAYSGCRTYCVDDFDGDGIIDLVGAFKTWPEGSVALYKGGEGIGYDKIWGQRTTLLETEPTVHGMTCTDWSGNGLPDIIVSNRKSEELIYLENLGDGIFAAPQRMLVTPLGCTYPTTIVTGDVDGDGITDLIICCKKSDVMIWIPGSSKDLSSRMLSSRDL